MTEYPTFDFDQVDFVTADTHFSHARISELAGRPFATVEEMDAALIQRWNGVVSPESVVLHLGDLALGGIADSLPLTAHLHGRRFLVPGNHDRVSLATQSKRAIERFTPLYEDAGWEILPEVIAGTRAGYRIVASHYPYSGDTQDEDRHSSHRPINRGLPLLHGHTHDRANGPVDYQFHVGVDAFDYAPIPMTLIDAWLDDLRREDDEIAALVRERDSTSVSVHLAEVAKRCGVDLDDLTHDAQVERAEHKGMNASLFGQAEPGHLVPEVLQERDKLAIRKALRAVWTDPVIDRWLESSNAFLDGARPIDVLVANDLKAVMEAVSQEVGGGYR